MNRLLFAAAAAAALLASPARSADLVVMASNAVKVPLDELAPAFERASGHKVTLKYGVSAVVTREMAAGAPFDLGIVTSGAVADLIKQGKMAAGSQQPVARTGVGMMVRAGAAKPDVGSPDALKKAVLSAKSITWVKEGASGAHFVSVLQKLGIAEQVKPTFAHDGTDAARKVASGEAEIGALVISEIVTQPGVQLAGPLPASLQRYIAFDSGVSTSAKNPGGAKAFAEFLTKPEARAVFQSKGHEPGL
jgi:molybdate transport system substrate-binding protein